MHHNCPYFHDESLLPEDLRELLEEELECFFMGVVLPEKQLINLPLAEEGRLSDIGHRKAIRTLLHSISRLASSVCQHTKGNFDISCRIAHDLLQHVGQAFNNSNEMRALNALNRLRVKIQNKSPIERYRITKKLNLLAFNVDAIMQMLTHKKGIQRDSLEQGLSEAINRSLENYESELYRSIIRTSLLPLVQELIQDAAALRDVVEKVDNYFGIRSAGWDYKNGQWQEIPWEVFTLGKQLLEDDPSIKRLADILGRGSNHGTGTAAIESVATENIQVEEYQGKMEILGVEFGHDLNLLFPSQYALFTDSDTEYYFYKELLEGKLFVARYQSMEPHVRKNLVFHPTITSSTTNGPIIISLDTSGSMVGWPEKIAKALCLALINVCRSVGRQLYLILFSSEIRALELSDLNSSLPEFAQFFAMEFRGGTDLRPALRESRRKLLEKRYTNADLLIISDFRVPKIMMKQDNTLKELRQLSRVHALTIGQFPIEDQFNIFDSQWHYRISANKRPMGISDLVEISSKL